MRLIHLWTLAMAFALGAAWSATPAQAEKRLALVIGINAYRDIPRLEKAVGDAGAVAQTLRGLGFQVTTVIDADRRALNRAVTLFQNQLQPGDIAFVHYSGHGVELDGQNYLLPADIPKPVAGAKDFIKAEALALGDLMDRVAASGARTRVFIIDACRDNPFAEAGTRGIGGTRGLSRVEAPAGTFILYSAGYKQTALDRLSNNDPETTSVYTRVLTRKLREAGKPLSQIAKEIRKEVEDLARSVGHEQRPAYYDELSGSLFIAGVPVPPQPSLPAPQIDERKAFETAQSIGTVAAWDAFLTRFPSGFYADMARAARSKRANAGGGGGANVAEADAERRVRDFVRLDYLKADFRDAATIRRLYASQVEYWGRGTVAIDTVIAEKVAFALAWPTLELNLDESSFAMSRVPGADKRYAATFRVRYELGNATSSVTGTSETTLEVALGGSRPVIMAEKGRVLTSKVGPPRASGGSGPGLADADIGQRLRDFIKQDYLGANFNDAAAVRALFAAHVDYWSKGRVPADTVVADKLAYASRWMSLTYDLIEDSFSFSRVPSSDRRYDVTFQSRFEARGPGKTISGTSESSLQIVFEGDRPKIAAENGRVLTRTSAAPNAATPQPQGEPSSYWTQNGSILYLVADGALRRFYYHKPRPAMLLAGAKPGSLLFAGRKDGNQYEGTAYTYSRRCGAFPYPASGTVEDGSTRVVVRGQVPQLTFACKVAGHRVESLVFDYLSRNAP